MKLYDAINKIVKLKGKSIISESALLNYLNDYHAFDERPASKLVLRDVVNGGYSDKILNLCHSDNNWTIKLKSYEHDFVDSCGYKEELVLYVFQSLAYASGLTDKKPGDGMDEVLDFHPFFDDEQLKPSDSTSTPEPKQTEDSVDDKDYLKIAQDFVDNGKLDTARSIAEKIVNSRPKDDENTIKATIMLGHIMRKKSQYKEALDYYNQALNAEANLLKISAKVLQHRITSREIKGFEDLDIHYMFCLFGIGHIDKDRWIEFVRSKAAKGNIAALIYCAQFNIDPQKHVDIFFDNYKNIREGDYLYEDGTFAHERSILKEAIGIVFSLSTSDLEKQNGWIHGRILGLPLITGKGYYGIETKVYPSVKWGEIKDLPFPHTHYTSDDLNHLDKINSKLFSELLINDQYDIPDTAFYIARNWKCAIPLSNSSKWYLPNLNQAGLIKQTYLTRDVSAIWTSSQGNKEEAIQCWIEKLQYYRSSCYAVGPSYHLRKKDDKNIVVPIFSF